MKRILGTALVAVALLASNAVSVGAAPGEGGPRCADIIGGSAAYTWGDPILGVPTSDQGNLTFTIETAAPSCTNLSYTMYVLDDTDSSTLLTPPVVRPGNGQTVVAEDGTTSGFVLYENIQFTDDDDEICVYHTSGTKNHVFDTAQPTNEDGTPADNCMTIRPPGAPGQGYH